MRILLTGSNGFIGKNIKESYLAHKYEVIAPRSNELNLLDQNSVEDYFRNKAFDVVIHAACKPGHRNAINHDNLLNSNYRMFCYLQEHRDKFDKFINLGSGAIYDMRNYTSKMKEEYAGIHVPVDEHGLCKYIVDKEILHLDGFVDLRIFGIFGKYEDYAIRFISNAICKNIFNLPITLRQNRIFDYLYIDDLMPILDWFINNTPKHKAYNITPTKSVELLQVANMVNEIGQNKMPIVVAEDGYGIEYTGDNSRLIAEVGSNVRFMDYSSSIQKLYEWYVKNARIISKTVLLSDK